MKILFLSGWGGVTPLAMHCQDYGHKVKLFVRKEDEKDPGDVGDGFVQKVPDYKAHIDWADLVICDDTHFGKINDSIRAKGIPVIGGTTMTDALEEDRGAGQRLFKASGMDMLNSQEFKSIDDAIAYVQENPCPYVIKVSGTAQNNKMTTYVGQMEDGADIIPVLEHMNKRMGKGLTGVEIQEKTEGIEVGVSAFFNGKKFIGPCQVNFEHKRLMSWHTQQGIGPQTGEMGTSAYWLPRDIALFQKVIQPMEGVLRSMKYTGDFDINCIVSKGKIYPLEMTNRFGWPTLPLQLETLKENDLGEFFMALATGQDFDLQPTYPVSLCVVIGIPPLPYTSAELHEQYSQDLPILFEGGKPPEGVYPGECKMEDGQWVVASTGGSAAVAAAGGYSIEECAELAYDIAEKVIIPNRMIRDDIGRTTPKAYKSLETAGFLSVKEESVK